MSPHIAALLKISSAALVADLPSAPGLNSDPALHLLLEAKNGFVAFESALHFYPSHGDPVSLETLHSPNSWSNAYPQSFDRCLFFAQDVFGDQYCRDSKGTYSKLELETGALTPLAATLEQLIGVILNDWEFHTGHPLAKAWQHQYGVLRHNQRLAPKIPFILGGAYALDNLRAVDTMVRLKETAAMAGVFQGLPDGTTVTLKI